MGALPLKDCFPASGFVGMVLAKLLCCTLITRRPDETVEVAFLSNGHKPHGNARVINSPHISYIRPHIQVLHYSTIADKISTSEARKSYCKHSFVLHSRANI